MNRANDGPLFRMDQTHAGQAVQAARRALFDPWTQSRLADESGLNQSHLSKLERAETPLTVPMLAHLLRTMGVISFEIRVQSGEIVIDGRQMRPSAFDRLTGRRLKPYLEAVQSVKAISSSIEG